MSMDPEYKAWRSELRLLARKAKLTWLLGNCDWTEHWLAGESPSEVMQAIADDANGRSDL